MQHLLFAKIREQTPSHLSVVDEIADVLGISTDSAYRRLRGETALTLDEAVKLSRHFNVSLPDLPETPRDTVTFRRVSISAQPRGFEDYLTLTRAYFEEISGAKEKRGVYAAKDIPVFYYFLFPELARFKLFFWLKTVKEVATLKDQSFASQIISEDFVAVSTAVARIYLRLPFTEIWNDETLNSTLRQIEYYHDAGLFRNTDDAYQLLDQLEALIQHIQQQAVRGVKLREGAEQAPYELYYNEILLLDNTILTVADGVTRVMLSYNAMDYLHTTDGAFCAEVQQWLRVQTEKSTLISRVSEKERNRFFNKMYTRIADVRRRVSL